MFKGCLFDQSAILLGSVANLKYRHLTGGFVVMAVALSH